MTTEEQQHSAINNFQAAIEAIEALTSMYKIKFTMTRTPGGIWKIVTMGKKFNYEDFHKACQEAVAFAFLAHNNGTEGNRKSNTENDSGG